MSDSWGGATRDVAPYTSLEKMAAFSNLGPFWGAMVELAVYSNDRGNAVDVVCISTRFYVVGYDFPC